jgi:hypothetical protein
MIDIEKWLQQQDEELLYEPVELGFHSVWIDESVKLNPVMIAALDRIIKAQERREDWICAKILSDYDKYKGA